MQSYTESMGEIESVLSPVLGAVRVFMGGRVFSLKEELRFLRERFILWGVRRREARSRGGKYG